MRPLLTFKLFVYSVVLSFAVVSCTTPKVEPHAIPGHITHLTGSSDIADSQEKWAHEVRERYTDAIIVFTHGQSEGGKWVVQPDIGDTLPVADMILKIRRQHATRRIVLIVCNPGHFKLDAPGVTYHTHNVWVTPDKYLPSPIEWARRWDVPDNAGSIWDFTENP